MLSLISSPRGILKEAKSLKVTQEIHDSIGLKIENHKGLDRV